MFTIGVVAPPLTVGMNRDRAEAPTAEPGTVVVAGDRRSPCVHVQPLVPVESTNVTLAGSDVVGQRQLTASAVADVLRRDRVGQRGPRYPARDTDFDTSRFGDRSCRPRASCGSSSCRSRPGGMTPRSIRPDRRRPRCPAAAGLGRHEHVDRDRDRLAGVEVADAINQVDRVLGNLARPVVPGPGRSRRRSGIRPTGSGSCTSTSNASAQRHRFLSLNTMMS